MPTPSLIRLWKDRRGVVSVYFAVVLTAMVLAMVAALDLMRVAIVRLRAQAALDAAVLAAGRNLGAERKVWEAEAKAYFAANLSENTMGASVSNLKATVESRRDGEYVRLDTELTIPLLITAFTDTGAMSFDLSTKARKKVQANLEMALAIDVTGSMGKVKMTAAKNAAKLAVTQMLGLNSGGNIAVGLVPFNETVNVGATATTRAWVDPPPTYLSNWQAEWEGCLMERRNPAGAYVLDDTPPKDRRFQAYAASRSVDKKNKNNKVSQDFVFVADDQSGCPDAEVRFLSSDITALTNAINAMTANGSTMVASGLVWAWRMVSPKWQGAWGDSTLPKPKDPELNKVVVLLSDGDNEVAVGTRYEGKWPGRKEYYYFNSPLGNVLNVPGWGNVSNRSQADKLTSQVCRAMKEDGVIVFTIPFGNSISPTTESLFKGCASDQSKYLRAKTNAELEAAFMTVVDTLSELVIVE